MKKLITIASIVLLSACSEQEPAQTTDQSVLDDPNSLQAVTEERTAREVLPGKAHYEKACANCHNGSLKKAPHRDMIGLMTPEAILATITTGIMKNEASVLSESEKIEVAEYLSGDELGGELASIPACANRIEYQPGLDIVGANWGISPSNLREIPESLGGISSANVDKLQVRWAIAMPGANRVRSQPTFAGGLLIVGSHSGIVYALDTESGCSNWQFQASGEVRTGISVAEHGEDATVFFGDVLANVYAVDAKTGELKWRLRADDHPNATITASPTPHNGVLYIPVSSLEVSLAIDPHYECCTFRGSVVAVDIATGDQKWKTYTIAEEPGVSGQNPIGTNIIGPSGAVVWNSPSIDAANNQLFVGTGENMSSPASLTSDALIAMDLDSGKKNWVFQATANDVWNAACDTEWPENCPVEGGPDFDFGGATVVAESEKHGHLVVAGQKSGVVHAVDPKTGKLVWQTKVGRGGIQGGIHFGIAVRGDVVLAPISDMADGRSYPDPDRPGMHALDLDTGEILWSTLHEDQCAGKAYCHPGISQVPTVIGDLVFGGSMDGTARAYDTKTGKVLWQLDTTDTFESITGEEAKGGSMGGAAGPVALDGLLVLSSGYGIYNHMAGNLLLALEVAEED